jgi:hypothetical protein
MAVSISAQTSCNRFSCAALAAALAAKPAALAAALAALAAALAAEPAALAAALAALAAHASLAASLAAAHAAALAAAHEASLASLAAASSLSVAKPFAYRSATSRASRLRLSVIKCCTCRAHHTAYNRISRSLPCAWSKAMRASSRPLLSRIVMIWFSVVFILFPYSINNYKRLSENCQQLFSRLLYFYNYFKYCVFQFNKQL